MKKYDCELYMDLYVIVPVDDGNHHCTAVFDLDTRMWSKLRRDRRKGNGTLVKTPGDDNKILFLGRVDGSIWEFRGLGSRWNKRKGIKVPMNIAKNGTKIVALHPDFCRNGKDLNGKK